MDHSPKEEEKRSVELVVLSDLHLGTVGCDAEAIIRYLERVHPGILILNGDVIDCWEFSKYYWPKSHTGVLKAVLEILAAGVPVYYILGNHDDVLRKYIDLHLGNLHMVNKLVLELDGKRAWFFHGDVFDVVMRHSRLLVKLGSKGYDLLILINKLVNWFLRGLGQGRISLAGAIKNGVKSAVKFIGDFERTAATAAVSHHYDYVVCGHIHQPVIKTIPVKGGKVLYLNSGDWIENLTALEYNRGTWSIYRYPFGKEEQGGEGKER